MHHFIPTGTYINLVGHKLSLFRVSASAITRITAASADATVPFASFEALPSFEPIHRVNRGMSDKRLLRIIVRSTRTVMPPVGPKNF